MNDSEQKTIKVCVNYGVPMPQSARDVERELLTAIESIHRHAQVISAGTIQCLRLQQMKPYMLALARLRSAWPEPIFLDVPERALDSILSESALRQIGIKPEAEQGAQG